MSSMELPLIAPQARNTSDTVDFDDLLEYKRYKESMYKQEQAKRDDDALLKKRWEMAEQATRRHTVFEKKNQEEDSNNICSCAVM